ncbi:hypothetical protein GN278_11125 [Rhodobacteraceae bacterium Araon29]
MTQIIAGQGFCDELINLYEILEVEERAMMEKPGIERVLLHAKQAGWQYFG